MERLQIGFEINTDKDPEYEIRLTPVDIPLPPDVAIAAKTLQAYLDAQDPNPGDGEADVPIKGKIPIKINLWIAKINTSFDLDANAFLKVKEA